MSDMLSIEQREQAWVFTLNRPEKMNALAPELVLALTEGIQAAHQQKIPLMIFKGNGKNFCAGFDFSDLDTASEGDLLQRIIQIEIMLDLLATSPSMTIALCHGRNFGAGVDIIAACKHRIAAAGTSFRFSGHQVRPHPGNTPLSEHRGHTERSGDSFKHPHIRCPGGAENSLHAGDTRTRTVAIADRTGRTEQCHSVRCYSSQSVQSALLQRRVRPEPGRSGALCLSARPQGQDPGLPETQLIWTKP